MVFDNPYWTLDEALSWAMQRVPSAVGLDPHLLLYWDDALDSRQQQSPLLLALDDAKAEVLGLMQKGRIRVVAGREPISPETLASAGIVHRDSGHVVAFPRAGWDQVFKGEGFLGEGFAELRLWSDDVRLHFKKPGSEEAQVFSLTIIKTEQETFQKIGRKSAAEKERFASDFRAQVVAAVVSCPEAPPNDRGRGYWIGLGRAGDILTKREAETNYMKALGEAGQQVWHGWSRPGPRKKPPNSR